MSVLRQIAREARAIAAQGRLIAGARSPRRERAERADGRVVLFVHGYMAAGPVFGPMRAHVERALGVATLDLTYGPLERFDRVVDRLERAIERAGDRPLDVVGHSLGGIVARWYLQERGGAARVERLITLASPHAGTRAARIGLAVPLARAIHPEGEVIATLRRGRAKASQVVHTAIVAGADRMITPKESAAALDDATVHWIEGLGHNEMLFDARVFEHVVAGLRR